RQLRPRAVRLGERLRRVLPALTAQVRATRAVLDVPVTVRIAVGVAPGERALGRRQQLAPELTVRGPLHGLGDEQREERRRVDRSVVRAVGDLSEPRELSASELVEDLPRLLLREVVHLLALVVREQPQRAAGDLGIPAERLVGADEPVASERDRVPRDPGGRVRTAVVELQERTQVERAAGDEALVERLGARRVARAGPQEAAVTRVQRVD